MIPEHDEEIQELCDDLFLIAKSKVAGVKSGKFVGKYEVEAMQVAESALRSMTYIAPEPPEDDEGEEWKR